MSEAVSTIPSEKTPPSVSRLVRVKASAEMAEAVTSALEHFLATFKWWINPDGSLNRLTPAVFFKQFIRQAELFTSQCCEEFAAILPVDSVRTDVRGMDAQALAKRVRATCFAELDSILGNCVSLVMDINIDLTEAMADFNDSPLREMVLKRSAPREFAGSPAEAGFDAAAAGVESDPLETSKKQILIEKQAALKTHAQELIFSKIVDYLRALNALPAALLDYGATKCFGGDVDFHLQKKVLLNIETAVESRRNHALELVLNLGSAEAKRAAMSREALPAAPGEPGELATKNAWIEAWGIGLLALAGICLFPAWLAVMTGSSSANLKGFTIIAGIVGCLSFFWGVALLVYSRVLDPTGAQTEGEIVSREIGPPVVVPPPAEVKNGPENGKAG